MNVSSSFPIATAPDHLGRVRRPISIQRLLEWAFAAECASIDFEDPGTLADGFRGIGTEYLLIQRCIVGCQIDGGGRSDPAPDADLVASAVAILPESVGGRRMSLQIADLSRARRVPDTFAGVVPKCEPAAWVANAHGRTAKKELLGIEMDHSGRKPRRHRVEQCPIVIYPDVSQIARARRNYLLWWSALLELKTTFQIVNDMSSWYVTDAMPPKAPWKKVLAQ